MFVEHIADEAAKVPVHSPENLYKSFYFLYKFSKNIRTFPEVYEEIGVINRHSIGLFTIHALHTADFDDALSMPEEPYVKGVKGKKGIFSFILELEIDKRLNVAALYLND